MVLRQLFKRERHLQLLVPELFLRGLIPIDSSTQLARSLRCIYCGIG